MKRLLSNQIIKAIIVVIIVSLVLGGFVYAYETYWTGKARISIFTPSPTTPPDLEVTAWSSDADGEWNRSSGTWTVTIFPGDTSHLQLSLENTGSSPISFRPYVGGEDIGGTGMFNYIPYVYIQATGDEYLDAFESGTITFRVSAYRSAPPGDLPELKLEIREH